MKHFLKSLESSYDKYSESADAQRDKLKQIEIDFKKLDKMVKKQLNVPPASPTEKTETRGIKSPTSLRRRPKKMENIETPVTLIRPAPYPIKNYVLPSQPLVGPARYYRPNSKKMMEEEYLEELSEQNRFPSTISRRTNDETPLRILSTPLRTRRNQKESPIDEFFESTF